MRNVHVLVVIAMLIGGCASGGDERATVKSLSSEDADKLNSGRSTFDSKADPPFKVETHLAAARLAESQNAPQQALMQYEQALKLDPKNLPALYRTAIVQTQLKQYPQAISAWKRYLQTTGPNSAAFSNLAFCYELSGNTAEAELTYQDGVNRFPNGEPCRVNYGLMLARQYRTNEAILQLEAVLTPAEVHYNLGSVFEQQKQFKEAKAEYAKAIELDPRLAEAKTRLAVLDKN